MLYAAKPEIESNYHTVRDALETAVIDDAPTRGLPLLGICRGAQRLNVCRGGTLYQELRSQRQKTSNRWAVLPLKTMCIADEPETRPSLLATLFGLGHSRINNLHNQSIDHVGAGLIVNGRGRDWIVRAIEDPSRDFLIGVQWHPGFLRYSKSQRSLFRHLMACAQGHVSDKQ